MKVIFLDIDGVLNSADYFDKVREKKDNPDNCMNHEKLNQQLNEEKVKLLKEIVDQTGAKIVLSSTWRILFNEKNNEKDPHYLFLEDTLNKYGLKIMSQTPYLSCNRPAEIKAWLNNRVDKDDIVFVSLDDDFRKGQYDVYGIGHCLVHTSFYEPNGGLRKEHVEKAIEILNGDSNDTGRKKKI